jgi:hypothetical protein
VAAASEVIGMSAEQILDAAGVSDPAARQHYVGWLPLERRQGEFFANLLLQHLPQPVDAAIRRERLSLLDIGCSGGHLVKRLHDRYRDSRVEGVDVEAIRIVAARHYYPECSFRLCDFAHLDASPDCIFSSNVLEHFAKPIEILEREFVPRARRFILSLVPWQERNLIDGHLASFDEGTFPERLGDFCLAHRDVIDCRSSGPDCWPGYQVLTVYERAR